MNRALTEQVRQAGLPCMRPLGSSRSGEFMTVLVTGVAGFVGFHVARRLLGGGRAIVGIDNLNDYYSTELKGDRIAQLNQIESGRFDFHRVDFNDEAALEKALGGYDIEAIVHLGAQPGVRYSLENPRAYIRTNVGGHLNMLELARHRQVQHMVYASSSSVYGANTSMPFRVEDRVDSPVSLYAATKKADELMSETYAHLFRIPLTGLRLFTVYGPWGRPDMAMWLFTKAILEGRPVALFNQGNMRRDFTYIDDIVEGIVACIDNPPVDDGLEKPGGSVNPHRIYNIGNTTPERLDYLIDLIEKACGKSAIRDLQPMQPGDLVDTWSDVTPIMNDLGFTPRIPLAIGVPRFVEWYRAYNNGDDIAGAGRRLSVG